MLRNFHYGEISRVSIYLPLHIVHKESSTITKIWVFDAPATTSTGESLN